MLDAPKEHCISINLWSPLSNWSIHSSVLSLFLPNCYKVDGSIGSCGFLTVLVQVFLICLKKILLLALNLQFCPDMQSSEHVMTYHGATPGNCKTPFFILGPIWQGSNVERRITWLNGEMKAPFLFRQILSNMFVYSTMRTYLDMCGNTQSYDCQGMGNCTSPSGLITANQLNAWPSDRPWPCGRHCSCLPQIPFSLTISWFCSREWGVKPENLISRLLCS